MFIEEEKWTPYFSQHARYHDNQEKGSIYSGCTDKPLSEI